MVRQLTAIIQREDDMYVGLCPKLDVASQGYTVTEARDNLKEALEQSYHRPCAIMPPAATLTVARQASRVTHCIHRRR